jgi:RNA polymerase sigma-19 factor, ECF subfamily
LTRVDYDDLRDRLQTDDRDALRMLYELRLPSLHRYVGRLVGDVDLARDLVHDAFVALWQARSRLGGQVDLVPYLYRIARNRALRHVRDAKLHEEKQQLFQLSEQREAPDTSESVDDQQMRVRLRRWLDELPPRQREALVLSRFHDLSHRQIAAIMDLSVRTVNNHIVRAVKALSSRASAFSGA